MSGNFFPVKQGQDIGCFQRFRFADLPQQPGDITEQWFRSAKFLTEKTHVRRFVPFGKTGSFPGNQHGQVQIFRHIEPQCLEKVDLRRGRTQQVAAPHHLIDAHQSVVYGHGQLVGEHAVAAADDDVAPVTGQVKRLGAETAVAKRDVCVRQNQPGGRPALFCFFTDFRVCQPAAGAGIDHAPVRCMGRVRHMQLRAAAEAGIDEVFAGQLFIVFFIYDGAFTLIRDVRIVPGDAQPLQIRQNLVRVGAWTADRVQVFNTQQEIPASAFGAEPGGQRGVNISQVHAPAGGRGETPHGLSGKNSFFFWHDSVL